MELFRAHYQWANRPDDERFESIADMRAQCFEYAEHAAVAPAKWNQLRVEATSENDLRLIGRQNVPATVSHWAMGQLASRASAPANYIRTLPATLAAQNINHGLAKRDDNADCQLLFHQNNGSLLLRAATGKVYERVWNYEVCDHLLALEEVGWAPAMPDPRYVIAGDPKSNKPDLYASDHDMFAFLIAPDRVIDDGSDGGLSRGLIVDNSEVGGGSLGLMSFLYRYMCGNHIIWGASEVVDVRIPHVGSIRDKLAETQVIVQKYMDSSASDDEARIEKARTITIGKNRDEVIDALFAMLRNKGLTRKALEAGYDACQPEVDGSPRTQWGIVNGLTRASQETVYADQRAQLDKAAGRVMEISF